MKECLEEGTIQAYVDGELSPEAAGRVAAHAAACAACGAALSDAENELALLAVAFEPELSLSVPSERLRERLDAAIGELRSQDNAPAAVPSWSLKKWLSSLAGSLDFSTRYATGFASLVAIVALTAIFAVVALRQRDNQSQLASVVERGNEINLNAEIKTSRKDISQPLVNEPGIARAGYSGGAVKSRRRNFSGARPQANVNGANGLVAESKPLPGEVSYLKTIASLSSVIEANGDSALRPSMRVEYERNLALVNHAIESTRRTARRNPKDPDAAEFLYSSYQNKIDLLSTVAEQGQMVAVAR
jgi:hypothetical protein